MVLTAVLKAVSLSGGHTVATELPTSMGIKQSSSLMLAMYVCMRLGTTKTQLRAAGGYFSPSTMAERPIQQMVVGHLCFQERAEQCVYMYVCMYVF